MSIIKKFYTSLSFYCKLYYSCKCFLFVLELVKLHHFNWLLILCLIFYILSSQTLLWTIPNPNFLVYWFFLAKNVQNFHQRISRSIIDPRIHASLFRIYITGYIIIVLSDNFSFGICSLSSGTSMLCFCFWWIINLFRLSCAQLCFS